MTEVLLDTSFILTCVRQKIDFVEDLKMMGLKVLIPKQVVGEIAGLAVSKTEAELALNILNKAKFKEIDLKSKNVDEGIIQYTQRKKDIFVATLDKEIKKKINNSVIVIREKKRLEVI